MAGTAASAQCESAHGPKASLSYFPSWETLLGVFP